MARKTIDNYYDYLDKQTNINNYIDNYLNRTNAMFRYHNLPDTIPSYMLELMLQKNGNVCIAEYESNLYAFIGGLGGEPDVYYQPTIYTVSNPALNFSKDLKIGTDCVVIKNDTTMQGLLPTMLKYSAFLVENDVSMMLATYAMRMAKIMSASDDSTINSCYEYLNQIKAGKQAVIADNAFLESLNIKDNSASRYNVIDDLIKQNQYLKSCMMNDIGLNANTNLKKERLISAEIETNSESLYPVIDNMLMCRKEGIEKVNQLFGTDIQVELNSSWDMRPYNGMSVHNTHDEIDIAELEETDENNTADSDDEQNTLQTTNNKKDDEQDSDEQDSDEQDSDEQDSDEQDSDESDEQKEGEQK